MATSERVIIITSGVSSHRRHGISVQRTGTTAAVSGDRGEKWPQRFASSWRPTWIPDWPRAAICRVAAKCYVRWWSRRKCPLSNSTITRKEDGVGSWWPCRSRCTCSIKGCTCLPAYYFRPSCAIFRTPVSDLQVPDDTILSLARQASVICRHFVKSLRTSILVELIFLSLITSFLCAVVYQQPRIRYKKCATCYINDLSNLLASLVSYSTNDPRQFRSVL